MVRTCAPKDRLLDFNVKEGWKALCKFLNEPVPDRPFPFRNKSGKPGQTEAFLEEIMKPHIRKCKIEVIDYTPDNILNSIFRLLDR